jgi:hypothetical protein
MNNSPIKSRFLWGFLFFLIAGLIAAFLPPFLTLSLVIVIFLVLFLMRHLDLGLIILVFFFPYLGLVIDLSHIKSLRQVPFLNQIDAPLVDIFGLILFFSWLLYVIIRVYQNYQIKKTIRFSAILKLFPFLKSFFPFLVSAVLSLSQVPSRYFYSSLKYLARPLFFFYLAFFLPTVSIIKKYGQDFLKKIFFTFYLTGLLTALMGFFSFFLMPIVGFPRAKPLCLFNFCPLGANHNLLAETLVATAPAGFLLWWLKKQETHSSSWFFLPLGKKWFFWTSVFQVIIGLLTFSRTAWLAFLLQLVIFLVLTSSKKELKERIKKGVPFLFFSLPLFGYLFWTLTTEVVESSTMARFEMIQIAWFYFLKHPWLGNGLETFIPTLWEIKAFLLEYGEPLDAHGVIWKLLFEQGLLGCLTFFFFVGIILGVIGRELKNALNEGNEEKKVVLLIAFLIAVGSLVYQLFNTTYYSSKLWVPLGIAAASAIVYQLNPKTT